MTIEVFASPIDPPAWDEYTSGGSDEWRQIDEKYYQQVERWLRDNGYTGKRTGKLWLYGVGDGNAVYMVAERRGSIKLIHLPVGDAWHVPDVVLRGLRQGDIREYVDAPKVFGEPR